MLFSSMLFSGLHSETYTRTISIPIRHRCTFVVLAHWTRQPTHLERPPRQHGCLDSLTWGTAGTGKAFLKLDGGRRGRSVLRPVSERLTAVTCSVDEDEIACGVHDEEWMGGGHERVHRDGEGYC